MDGASKRGVHEGDIEWASDPRLASADNQAKEHAAADRLGIAVLSGSQFVA